MGKSPEYIGQRHIWRQLRPIIDGARKAGRPLLHIMLLGMSGLGKTFLANHICELYGLRTIKSLYRPDGVTEKSIAVEAQSWQECEIIFVDEAHRLSHRVQECLFRVMVERKAPKLEPTGTMGAPEICGEVDIPQVTIIAATDKPSLLLPAFRSRFGLTYTLRPYSFAEMIDIVKRRARENALILTTPAAKSFAVTCRGTPRYVRHRIAAVKDYYGISGRGELTLPQVRKFLFKSGFDLQSGLSADDQRYLRALANYKGGPLSLSTLTNILTLESEYLQAEVESFLIREGFVVITPSGRVLTEKGKQVLGGTKA